MPGPQFSTPSLQELLLTARTGADQGAGAINAAGGGVRDAMALQSQMRAAEIKRKLEERGMALQEDTLTKETELAGKRITATENQTKATESATTSRERIARDERLAQKEKIAAEVEKLKAESEYLKSVKGRNLPDIKTKAELYQDALKLAIEKTTKSSAGTGRFGDPEFDNTILSETSRIYEEMNRLQTDKAHAQLPTITDRQGNVLIKVKHPKKGLGGVPLDDLETALADGATIVYDK